MENFTEFLEKLNPYESQGYNCHRLRELKELLIEFPEMAKLAFDTMDFAGKVWGGELQLAFKKTPLGSVSQFFYFQKDKVGGFNSVQQWAELQILGIRQDIESKNRYILTLKKEKERNFWKDTINNLEQDIVKIQSELSKLN